MTASPAPKVPAPAPKAPAKPSFLKKLGTEIALVLGTAAGIGEAASTALPPGAVRDAIQAAIPLLAAVGIRQNVIPLDTVIASEGAQAFSLVETILRKLRHPGS